MYKAQEKTHVDEVVGLVESTILARCAALAADPALTANFSALVRRVVELAGATVPAQQQIGLAVRFLFSGLIDADRIDTADFEHKRVAYYRPRGNYVAWPLLIDRLEKKLGAMTPMRPIDVLRNEISADCLAAASRERGVYTRSWASDDSICLQFGACQRHQHPNYKKRQRGRRWRQAHTRHHGHEAPC